MPTSVSGRLGRIVYAQFEPGEDLYDGLLEVIADEKIDNGLVLDITGGLSEVRLSMPLHGRQRHKGIPQVFEMDGLTEIHGGGIIGRTMGDFEFRRGGIVNRTGEPYMHVHLGITVQGISHTGHLISGCKVLGDKADADSHFTVVLAETEGIDLQFHVTEPTEVFPHGLAYHVLSPAGG